jgi:hypothetical protein
MSGGATQFVFKGARVYKRIGEQYPPDTIEVPGMDNHYVFIRDIDPESESEVDTDPSTDGSLSGSFIASDTSEIQEPIEEDEVWTNWRPMSSGAQRFKDKVNQLEAHAKKYIDERFIFGD